MRTTPTKRSTAAIFTGLLVFVVFPNASGQSGSVVKMRSLQIDAEARPGIGQFAPADDGLQYLVYELFVTNWNEQDLRFAAVDLEDAATGKRFVRFDSKALDDPLRLSTTMRAGTGRLLPAWRTAIITMEVKLPLGASVPGAVRHRIEFESDPNLQLILDDGSLSSELVSLSEPMPINLARPLVIGPPLRGGPWFCNNGIGAFTNHDGIYASKKIARLHVPQRFGCDFDKVDADSYGADVIAVADGRVVKAQEGIPENVRQGDAGFIMPVPLTDRTVTGNMIGLEIGKGQYAFYAHLQLGSLRVKVGDQVRKGQLLAKVGNSGNATGPGLHFHVGSGPELNAYDAVPHVYSSYWLSGRGKPHPTRRRKVEFQVPTKGSIMTFSGSGDEGSVATTPAPAVSSTGTPLAFGDTFTRHYPLGRTPRIGIRGLTGPVVISSRQTQTIDIEVQRSAVTQQELDCYQTKIDHRPDLITITHVQFTDRPGCRSIRARQAITLQVPSDAFLRLTNIDEEVQVTGPVGRIIAENIGGHVSIAAAGTVDLRSLANGASLRLGAASPGSATIESVFGNVEFDVTERPDVEIRVSSLVGEVRSVPSGFVRLKTDDGYLLKSGKGGSSLTVKRIDGDLVVRRR